MCWNFSSIPKNCQSLPQENSDFFFCFFFQFYYSSGSIWAWEQILRVPDPPSKFQPRLYVQYRLRRICICILKSQKQIPKVKLIKQKQVAYKCCQLKAWAVFSKISSKILLTACLITSIIGSWWHSKVRYLRCLSSSWVSKLKANSAL